MRKKRMESRYKFVHSFSPLGPRTEHGRAARPLHRGDRRPQRETQPTEHDMDEGSGECDDIIKHFSWALMHNEEFLQDSAMILEEQPGKVAEAFLLFLQGQGYCLHMRKKKMVC